VGLITILLPYHRPERLSRNLGTLTLGTLWAHRVCNGTDLPLPLFPIFLAQTETISGIILNEKEAVPHTLYVVILKTVLDQKESNMGTSYKYRIF